MCDSRSLQKRSSSGGFTLVELVLVIVLLGLSLPMLITVFGNLVKDSSSAILLNRSQGLLRDLVEEVHSRRWDDNLLVPAGGGSAVLGAEAGEMRVSFDDIDDYNGLNNSPPAGPRGGVMDFAVGYSRAVFICYVSKMDFNTCIAGPSEYKRVSITVTSPDGEQIDLVEIMGNWR